MSNFTEPLHLNVHDLPIQERPFELLQPFAYWTEIGCARGVRRLITVPARYRTDFASIPRLLWHVLPPFGRYGKAAVVHDWLCNEAPHSVDHITAAQIFGEAMQVLGVRWVTRTVMVRSVVWFGPKFAAWSR